MVDLVEIARGYVDERHWSVIPVVYRSVEGVMQKQPAVKWKEYQTRRASPGELQAWFTGRHTAIGIVTGAISGLTVVDCDSEDAYRFIRSVYPVDTPMVKTRRGYHLYFQYEKQLKTVAGVFDGVDVRSDGGLVVAPPSPFTDGSGAYAFMDTGVPIAKMPANLLTALRQKTCAEFRSSQHMDDLVGAIAGARPGNRNEQLFLNACRIYTRLARGLDDMSADEAGARILEAGIACGMDGAEVKATMESARNRAYKPDDESAKEQLTQAEVADLAAKKHPDLVYLQDEQEWLEYDPGRGIWAVQHDLDVASRIQRILDRVMPKYTANTVDSVRKLLMGRLRRSAGETACADDILVFRNTAVDMGTLEPRGKCREFHARSYVDVDIAPGAQCPEFTKFLSAVCPSGVIPMVQEFCGYCLTRDTRHEKFLWLYSEQAGAGKSTLIWIVSQILGDGNVGVLPVARISDKHSLKPVHEKRLVMATEASDEHIKACDTLNSIVSGEEILIDEKYKRPYKYRPFCKLMYAANNLPRVNGNDGSASGLFRRALVVEMKCVPEDQRDPRLKEKLRAESEGIVWWMLEGLRRLNERGRFDVPEEVRSLAREVIGVNDTVQAFVDEHYVVTGEDTDIIGVDSLFLAYTAYCSSNGNQPLGKPRFSMRLKSMGLKQYRTAFARGYSGLKHKMRTGA